VTGRMVHMRKEDVKTEEDVKRYLADWSEFERAVYLETYKIPRGKVSTYGRIAAKIGRPGAYRAVANTLHNNPLHPIVPCQRVVKADGSFGGRKDHAAGRRAQVVAEGTPVKDGRVVMSDDVIY
jgi:O-6-methylguanine DNA methyltransferase